jgi:capsular polysaccharide transport system ATP-binding protein
MIRLEKVVKSYRLREGRKVVLRDLTATFPKTNVAILGANGAGKSTLLRLIAGTELPDSGVILRQGRISWPLGFAGSFNGTLSGAENVRFVARIYGEDTERVLDFVQAFSELGEFFRMPVSSYSSGMRARLAFGVSMAVAFDYYLVDEITAVGDDKFRQKCLTTFKEKLANSGIIMISHSKATLKQYCRVGAVLHQGELTMFDDLNEAIALHEQHMKA